MTTWGLLTSCWHLDELALGACLAAPLAYLASSRARRRIRAVPAAAALLMFVLALASPIGQLAEGYLFSAHMLQHLLLVLVVPPLALLGLAPAPKGEGDGLASGRASRFVPRPVIAWSLGVGAMWLWHERTLCDAASQSVLVHRVQELSLVVMGVAFWWPVLGPRQETRLPPLGGVVYLFTACVACTLLGVLITFSPVRVCSVFAHPVDRLGVMPVVRDAWGLTVEKDQQIGGLLMWVPACLVYGIGIMGLLSRMFRDEEQPTTSEVAS
jgi:cytochrome c oxidase assembly factor CtaG